MTQITLQIPQVGQSDSTEDPKVASDLTIIQAAINGQLDQTNVAVAASFLMLKPAIVAGNTGAATGTLYRVTATATITLPLHSAGQVVGVINGGGTTTVSGTSIQGVGLSSASSFTLGNPGAAVVLVDDGANWNIVAGQQDTGWVAIPLSTNWGTVGYAPSYRVLGSMVYLSGSAFNNTGGSSGTPFVSPLPAAMRPANEVEVPIANAATGSTPNVFLIATNGTYTIVPVGNGSTCFYDGASYRLV